LRPPRTVCLDAVPLFEQALAKFQTLAYTRAAALDVAVLPRAWLVREHGFVITHDGLLAAESAWDDDKIGASAVLALRHLPARVVPGIHASLISQWCGSYFHWITDALPRLRILEVAGCSDVPLIVPDRPASWQTRSLELASTDPRQLTPFSGCLRPETLVWPRPAALTGHIPRWACSWLRERFVRHVAPPRIRLYLTRREHARQVTNEDEIVSLLRPLGFDVVDPGTLTLDEQIAMFADAEIVIAPHGGALTNVVFGQNTVVIEIFDPDYINPCYYAMADRCDHEYWYVVGQTEPGGHLRVSPALLTETLTRIRAPL
jgi:capsular polysaccharide biosynthesis protein